MKSGRGKRLKNKGLLILFLLLSCLIPPGGDLRAEIRTLSYSNGSLTLNVMNEEASKVISQVSSIVGFDAHFLPPSLGKKTISVSFENLPVEKAVLRLIRAVGVKNYSLSFGRKGEIEEVKIIGEGLKEGTEDGRGREERPKSESAQKGDRHSPDEEKDEGIDLIEDEQEETANTGTPSIPPPVPVYRYKPVSK